MHEIKTQLKDLGEQIQVGIKSINLPEKQKMLAELNDEMQNRDFWDDTEHAQEVSQKASNLQKEINAWQSIENEIKDLTQMLPEIHPELDEETANEYKEMVFTLEKKWKKLEISTFLSGKYDDNNAILMIHAGTGGTDAQDFAEMLLRMYLRYAEKNDFKTTLMEKSLAEEAGIKSCTVEVQGQFAYGYLKNEAGVHRLVRLSPFNTKHTRETSFVLVEVLPEISKSTEIEIHPDDLKIDVFKAGGHGGQSVNTTDSAVRITHLPTNTVVQCQNERSQLQNKEQAMKILHARLVDLMEQLNAKELKELKGAKTEMSWGNQIRSYVLHPYKMVKDHRTDYEESNPEKVLDGEIQGFIEAELKK